MAEAVRSSAHLMASRCGPCAWLLLAPAWTRPGTACTKEWSSLFDARPWSATRAQRETVGAGNLVSWDGRHRMLLLLECRCFFLLIRDAIAGALLARRSNLVPAQSMTRPTRSLLRSRCTKVHNVRPVRRCATLQQCASECMTTPPGCNSLYLDISVNCQQHQALAIYSVLIRVESTPGLRSLYAAPSVSRVCLTTITYVARRHRPCGTHQRLTNEEGEGSLPVGSAPPVQSARSRSTDFTSLQLRARFVRLMRVSGSY